MSDEQRRGPGPALPLIAAVAGGALLVVDIGGKTPYFFGPAVFFGLALLGFLLATASRRLGWTAGGDIAWPTGCVMFAYAIMEVVYQWVPLRLPLTTANPAGAAFLDLVNGYFLDRSYQYVAIVVLWLLLRPTFSARGASSFVAAGDTTQVTTILGEDQPMTWTRVGVRLAVMMVVLGGISAGMKMTQSFDDRLLAILSGRVLGGCNNSLIEELVFRGLLLPIFATAVRPTTANWLQAAFFAVIHYTFIEEWEIVPVAQEAGKLALYLGIGWFLGRAALDTRGIGISTLLHALITAVIWATLTLSGS